MALRRSDVVYTGARNVFCKCQSYVIEELHVVLE